MNIKSSITRDSTYSGLFILIIIVISLVLIIQSSLPVCAQQVALYGSRYAGPDGPATLYSIDYTTGDATEIGPIGFERCGGMDFGANGALYATAERIGSGNTSVLININLMTGFGTEIGEIGSAINETFFDVSFRNSDGVLFTSTFGPDCVALGTLNTETGLGTYIGETQTCSPGNAIAFSPSDILFHCNVAGNGMLYTLNPVTGQATNVTPLLFPVSLTAPTVNAMDYNPNSGVLYATVKDKPDRGEPDGSGSGAPKYLTTIDTETGVVTIIGETVTGLDAIAFSSGLHIGGEAYPVNWTTMLPLVLLGLMVFTGLVLFFKHRKAEA